MKNTEQELFELVSSIGETIVGKLHIIDMSDSYSNNSYDRIFKVYHGDGYCFDVIKEDIFNDETDEFIETIYSIFSDYEGFKQIDTNKAIELVKHKS